MRLADIATMDEGQLISSIALFGGEYDVTMDKRQLAAYVADLVMQTREKSEDWGGYVWQNASDSRWYGFAEQFSTKSQIIAEGHDTAAQAETALRMSTVQGRMIVYKLDHAPTDNEVVDLPTIWPNNSAIRENARKLATQYFKERDRHRVRLYGGSPRADLLSPEGRAAKAATPRAQRILTAPMGTDAEEIETLLKEKPTADAKRQKQIRQRLRALGYRLSEQKKSS